MGKFEYNTHILHQAETERDFLRKVADYALLRGWMVHHVLDTRIPAKRMGHKGFPDLVLLRQGRLVIVELKSEKGRCTPEQKSWLAAFREVGVEAPVWKPSDWELIMEVLK